jgi:hypothetical protein
MVRFVFCLAAIIAFQTTCFGKVINMPRNVFEALQKPGQFNEINSITNLPLKVRSLCADANGRIADKGQKWEATDLITDPPLPRKRFIWAATNAEYIVVYFEKGGYAKSFHTVIFQFQDQKVGAKWKQVWHAVDTTDLKNFHAFLDALKNRGVLDDQTDQRN